MARVRKAAAVAAAAEGGEDLLFVALLIVLAVLGFYAYDSIAGFLGYWFVGEGSALGTSLYMYRQAGPMAGLQTFWGYLSSEISHLAGSTVSGSATVSTGNGK